MIEVAFEVVLPSLFLCIELLALISTHPPPVEDPEFIEVGIVVVNVIVGVHQGFEIRSVLPVHRLSHPA